MFLREIVTNIFNKIRDLFKVKLYIIRSKTKRERERESEREKERESLKRIYLTL